MDFVVCSRWWGRGKYPINNKKYTYEKIAQRLKQNCKRLGLKYYIIEFPELTKIHPQIAINKKAEFISNCLKRFDRVLYVDIDMIIHKFPTLFENNYHVDFMAFNWNYDSRLDDVDPFILELASQVLYFQKSWASLKLLELWKKEIKRRPKAADDRLLAYTFYTQKAIRWCRVDWLPFEYDYNKNPFDDDNDKVAIKGIKPVISHPDVQSDSNNEVFVKNFGNINRVPNNTDLSSKVKKRNFCIGVMNRPHMKAFHRDLALKQYKICTVNPNKNYVESNSKYDLIVKGNFNNFKLNIKKVIYIGGPLSNHFNELMQTKGLTRSFNNNSRLLMGMRIKTI